MAGFYKMVQKIFFPFPDLDFSGTTIGEIVLLVLVYLTLLAAALFVVAVLFILIAVITEVRPFFGGLALGVLGIIGANTFDEGSFCLTALVIFLLLLGIFIWSYLCHVDDGECGGLLEFVAQIVLLYLAIGLIFTIIGIPLGMALVDREPAYYRDDDSYL